MYRPLMATNFADTVCKIATGRFVRRCLTNSLDAVARIRRHNQQKLQLLIRNDFVNSSIRQSDSWVVVNLMLAGLSKQAELNGAASLNRVRAPVRSIHREFVSFSTPLDAISRLFDQCGPEPTPMLKRSQNRPAGD
jgi:hypothetical protein